MNVGPIQLTVTFLTVSISALPLNASCKTTSIHDSGLVQGADDRARIQVSTIPPLPCEDGLVCKRIGLRSRQCRPENPFGNAPQNKNSTTKYFVCKSLLYA